MTRAKFDLLVEKNATLKEAYDFTLMTLGNRREGLATFDTTVRPGPLLANMPQYDEDWKRNELWHADLRQKESAINSNRIQYVVLSDFPVPEKLKNLQATIEDKEEKNL